jgi:hypothetical protein
MTNSDNKYGTYNKVTTILSQIKNNSIPRVIYNGIRLKETPLETFANVEEAKTFFYTDAALAVFDECCTELQWALVGTTGLKHTIAFGIKDGQISHSDHWAEQYNSRKNSLRTSNNWHKNPYSWTETDSHLF